MFRILDSTLREGEQTPGVCFDVHIKIAIADLLDQLGVDIIEAGHPVVTEEIHHAVEEIAKRNLKSTICAHARSMQKDVDLALECGVGFIGIFYCVSEERLDHHSKDLTTAVDRIASVIRYAKEKNPKLTIRYTPEDTVRSHWQNVITAASEAVRAGADIISVADTTGYMIPGGKRSMYDYVKRLKDTLGEKGLTPEIEVHCHNDRGLALANAMDGFRGGATVIDAACLSLGERTGIVDLASLLALMATDFDMEDHWDLKVLPELYELVSRYSGLPIPVNAPVVGGNAFTHCAGVHTQAAIKNPLHYQSIQPETFGRKSRISLDHMSGLSAVNYSLEMIGELDFDKPFAMRVLEKVKEVGYMGRIVDQQELKYIVKYIREH
ncbi:MAG: 2-isopropylmalate synthase [bacterium]|nr:2-isopropylmalate synthase [bacterium]